MSLFALYRFYDSGDALLYIGRSVNPGRRFTEHRSTKAWWRDIARIEITHYSSACDLSSAETYAIATDGPLHNKTRPHDPTTYVTSDSDPAEGCSEYDDTDTYRCGRRVSFQTGLGNFVCHRHAPFYGVLMALPGEAP